jgi:hypothetical protein
MYFVQLEGFFAMLYNTASFVSSQHGSLTYDPSSGAYWCNRELVSKLYDGRHG